ncbi:hypothetical protein AB1Y20_019139 [Prymnesium parvum]|uniref:Uncharacterized protein n=1 Tax=Prymnesium parvum TaxID=97485 RepID=A0AB34JQI9_PRYPA
MLPLAAQCAPPHGAAPPPSEYICSLHWPSNWTRLSVRLDLASGTWRREHARAWLEPRIQRELSLEQMLLKVERELLSPPSHRPECEREALPARLGWEGPADELPLVLDAVWEWDRSQAWRTVHPPELQAYLADRVRLLHVRVPFEGADVLELGPSADVERLLASGRVVEVLPGVWRVDRLVNARFASWALANLAPLGPQGADALGLQPIFERVTAALSPLLTRLTGVAGFDHSFVFSRKYDSSDTPRAACDDASDARSEQTCASTQQSVLRHDAHHDDSHVTVNILLSPPGVSEASKIAFCGRFGTDQYRQLSGILDWANATLFPQGSALIHLGELRHRAFRISHGRRYPRCSNE